MHHDCVLRRQVEMIQMKAIMDSILAHGWKERLGLAFSLHAQNHDDIGIDDGVFDGPFEFHALFD